MICRTATKFIVKFKILRNYSQILTQIRPAVTLETVAPLVMYFPWQDIFFLDKNNRIMIENISNSKT